MSASDWIRKLWFELLVSVPVPGTRVGTCRRFVPDQKGSLPGVYCRVCGYDIDQHEIAKLVRSAPDTWGGL